MKTLLTLLKTKVSGTAARPIRGGVQGGVSYGIVDLIDSFHHLTGHQFGASVFLLSMVVSFIQNYLEDRGTIPALLKNVPPEDDPVPVLDTSDVEPKKKTTAKKTTKKTSRRKK